jgi:hypothetical protein
LNDLASNNVSRLHQVDVTQQGHIFRRGWGIYLLH